MSSQDGDDGGREAALRWLVQQLARSVENLEDLDLDLIGRGVGLDAERVKEYLDIAGRWIADQADGMPAEVLRRFGSFVDVAGRGGPTPSGGAPHPLDVPSSAQGVALSAIDSGRWSVKPGSHEFIAHDQSPAPEDASGLIGDLRARDWINAAGEITQVGRNALTRWMDQSGE
jgi:hypothetical protein